MQRQGRSDTYATEYDLEAEEYVPLPKGDVHKKREVAEIFHIAFWRIKKLFYS